MQAVVNGVTAANANGNAAAAAAAPLPQRLRALSQHAPGIAAENAAAASAAAASTAPSRAASAAASPVVAPAATASDSSAAAFAPTSASLSPALPSTLSFSALAIPPLSIGAGVTSSSSLSSNGSAVSFPSLLSSYYPLPAAVMTPAPRPLPLALSLALVQQQGQQQQGPGSPALSAAASAGSGSLGAAASAVGAVPPAFGLGSPAASPFLAAAANSAALTALSLSASSSSSSSSSASPLVLPTVLPTTTTALNGFPHYEAGYSRHPVTGRPRPKAVVSWNALIDGTPVLTVTNSSAGAGTTGSVAAAATVVTAETMGRLALTVTPRSATATISSNNVNNTEGSTTTRARTDVSSSGDAGVSVAASMVVNVALARGQLTVACASDRELHRQLIAHARVADSANETAATNKLQQSSSVPAALTHALLSLAALLATGADVHLLCTVSSQQEETALTALFYHAGLFGPPEDPARSAEFFGPETPENALATIAATLAPAAAVGAAFGSNRSSRAGSLSQNNPTSAVNTAGAAAVACNSNLSGRSSRASSVSGGGFARRNFYLSRHRVLFTSTTVGATAITRTLQPLLLLTSAPRGTRALPPYPARPAAGDVVLDMTPKQQLGALAALARQVPTVVLIDRRLELVAVPRAAAGRAGPLGAEGVWEDAEAVQAAAAGAGVGVYANVDAYLRSVN